MFKVAILFAAAALLSAAPAEAYVGPGSSLGAVGIFLGLVGTVILTLLSFVWYPFKRMARRFRRKDPAADKNPE